MVHKYKRAIWVAIFFLALFVATAEAVKGDKRVIKTLTLENGLDVFLVSESLWMCLKTHDKSQFDMINEVFNKMYEKNKKKRIKKLKKEKSSILKKFKSLLD